MAGARNDEIIARKLPQKLRLEWPVWMKQIEDSCTRYGSTGASQLSPKLTIKVVRQVSRKT